MMNTFLRIKRPRPLPGTILNLSEIAKYPCRPIQVSIGRVYLVAGLSLFLEENIVAESQERKDLKYNKTFLYFCIT